MPTVSTPTFRIAAVQAAPVFLDPDASTEKACALITQAAAGGATLVAFGETWLPGYCRWVNAPVRALKKRDLGGRYLAASIRIPGPHIDQICNAAKQSSVDVVIGVAELDPVTEGTTYCTLVFISSDGTILGKHRKLKPTYAERTAWGDGDATGLRTHKRPYATISGLNCWEHNMVLPGYTLMAEGTQVHIAAFPGYETVPSGTRQLLLSRAFASQGACYVVLVGGLLRPEDVPDPVVREIIEMMPPLTGDSYIIDPYGEIICGPAVGEEIIYADASLDEVRRAKSNFDVAGHYSRPDIFNLSVNRNARSLLTYVPESTREGTQ
jgi:nitrilase